MPKSTKVYIEQWSEFGDYGVDYVMDDIIFEGHGSLDIFKQHLRPIQKKFFDLPPKSDWVWELQTRIKTGGTKWNPLTGKLSTEDGWSNWTRHLKQPNLYKSKKVAERYLRNRRNRFMNVGSGAREFRIEAVQLAPGSAHGHIVGYPRRKTVAALNRRAKEPVKLPKPLLPMKFTSISPKPSKAVVIVDYDSPVIDPAALDDIS